MPGNKAIPAAGKEGAAKGVSAIPHFLFGLALLFIPALDAGALEAFAPSETMDNVFIGKYAGHYVDPTKQLTLADVRSDAYRPQFAPVNSDTLNFGMSDAAHWIHLTINNPGNVPMGWIMQAEHPLLNHIEVYEIGPDGEVTFHEGGNQIPLARRDIAYRKNAFSMSAQPGTGEIYIKVWPKWRAVANCSFTAWGTNQFVAKNSIDTLLLGFYYGALLVMCLYNLFIYFSVRETVYLTYGAYILFAGFTYFGINGLAFQYLWPASPYMGMHSPLGFGIISFALGISFSRAFLNTKAAAPSLDKVLLGIALFCVSDGILTMIEAKSFPYAITAGYLSTLVFPPLLIYAGVRSLMAGVRQARFYVAAWTVYLAGVMLYFLKDFGVLPYSFITIYSIQIGTLIDVLLLSFALADRIKILRGEKEAARNQVAAQEQRALKIAEEARGNLEKEVAERTAQLAESEDRYRSLSDAAFEGIVVHDRGIILDVNEKFLQMTGYGRPELIGKNILELLVPPAYRETVEKNLASGMEETYEVHGKRKDGAEAPLEVRGQPIHFQGKSVRVTAVRDISERKNAERVILAAKEKAEEATRLKDNFISLVAHDLKSPLASLYMGLNALHGAKDLSPDNRYFIGKMADNSRALHKMTERLLDLSLLQAGRMLIQKRVVNCRDFAAAQAGLYEAMAAEKGITIINSLPEKMRMYADPNLFGECVKNVLSNAVKFCGRGDSVTIFSPPDMPNAIAVKDTGPGVAPEKMPAMLTAGMKMHSIGTAGEKGTGIGLAHTREIMAAHGGAITFESAPGGGSTFYLTLPAFDLTVLVVDDDEASTFVIGHYLKMMGAGVLTAKHGAEALEVIRRRPPFLVITDIEMPVMDGYALLQNLKNSAEYSHIPVIVITGNNDMDARKKAFSCKADDFITKPLSEPDFIPRIGRFIAG